MSAIGRSSVEDLRVLLVVDGRNGAEFLEVREQADQERGERTRFHELVDRRLRAGVIDLEVAFIHRDAEVDLLIFCELSERFFQRVPERVGPGSLVGDDPCGDPEWLLHLVLVDLPARVHDLRLDNPASQRRIPTLLDGIQMDGDTRCATEENPKQRGKSTE